jgi:DNA-binding NarL/FixJ family response regulator
MSAALKGAIHDLSLDEFAWVEALFAEGRALLDEGMGLFAYSYRVEREAHIRLGALAGQQTSPDLWQTLATWGAAHERTLSRVYQTAAGSLGGFLASARGARNTLADPRPSFASHGVADLLTLVGHDPSGFGVFLTVPRARAADAWGPKRRSLLARLAVELATAARIRSHQRRTHAASLSASEERVARLLLEGAADKVIAVELGVTLSTVSTFTRRMREKLGCRPGEELVRLSAPAPGANLERRLALFERLTASECDVASELLVGSSYAEIAERRGVSVRTVASQCTAVFRKCGVSGRRELASLLLRG